MFFKKLILLFTQSFPSTRPEQTGTSITLWKAQSRKTRGMLSKRCLPRSSQLSCVIGKKRRRLYKPYARQAQERQTIHSERKIWKRLCVQKYSLKKKTKNWKQLKCLPSRQMIKSVIVHQPEGVLCSCALVYFSVLLLQKLYLPCENHD